MTTPEEFQALWDSGKENHIAARELAREYVKENRDTLWPTLGPMNLIDLVRLVDQLRAAGQERERIIVDMWLLAEHEPQQIGASVNYQGDAAVYKAFEALTADSQTPRLTIVERNIEQLSEV